MLSAFFLKDHILFVTLVSSTLRTCYLLLIFKALDSNSILQNGFQKSDLLHFSSIKKYAYEYKHHYLVIYIKDSQDSRVYEVCNV